MIFEHSRFEIWSASQHPFKHTLSDFAYYNPAIPGGSTNVESALNTVFKILYPNTKTEVANPAALPLVGNTLNDYRVVLDDGDGKQAGYRWEQREGDVAPLWYKIYDFDWSTDAILAAFTNVTQGLYVYQKGKTDLDVAGNPVVGLFAGQTVFGGNLINQNLTLKANSGDGVGAATGYVQMGDNVRPTVHNTFDLGTLAAAFKDAYIRGSIVNNTLTITGALITDSTGTISFDNEHLVTTGNISGAVLTGSTSLVTGTMTITGGNVADSSGALSFNALNVTTTGTITAAINSVLGNLTFSTGSIISGSGAITFGAANLTTTGTLAAGNATLTRMDSDNVRIDGNSISILNVNGSLTIAANGTGVVDIQSALTTLGQTITGVVGVTGQLNIDNLRLDANTISSTNLNGNITLAPNGTGSVLFSGPLAPTTDNSLDVGAVGSKVRTLFLGTSISDDTTAITVATLLSLRDINVSAAAGMSLFYDGSKWNASAPDTEITHSTISGLTTGDAGHTQFVMLAGRAGGQSIVGGIANSEHLNLESTSAGTKGFVKTKDSFVAFTGPTFSGGWSGTDLGTPAAEFRNLYTKGELIGARLQNVLASALPSASGQNIGRAVWATDVNKIYVDIGGTWQVAGSGKYLSDTTWSGVQTTQTFTVSSTITDARTALWALHDNANDFEQIFCTIKSISATQVQITVTPALPAGSYRLIGLE